ncbi:MAG TPA: primosomal protein N' [Acidobacteriota bacterium]|nr:primosomal protein N' [Acidobacteriota bacterium]
MRTASVSIPKSTLGPLTYLVPDNFPDLTPGMRVLVPLGARFVTGFVVDTDVEMPDSVNTRTIADLIDSVCLFSPVMLRLTKWMADYYLAEWGDLLKSALPPALDVRPERVVKITAKGEFDREAHPVLDVLRDKKALPLRKLYEMFGTSGTYSQVRQLEQRGDVELIAHRKPQRRGYNMVERIEAADPPPAKKERLIYDYLLAQPGAVTIEELRGQFGNAATTIRKMARSGQVRCYWLPASVKAYWPDTPPVKKLNEAQEHAFNTVLQKRDSFGVFLLHGVTGSGKTEVYLRLAQQVLAAGKTVLILVPEIALLPLIVHRTEQALGRRLSILHSELGERERLEEWQKARKGEIPVVLGTRSAVFAPLRKVGLIVMDEEHDGAYKQGEYPRYHARESAIIRAQYEGCPIVLGSATPSIESFYNAGNGKYTYLALARRIESRKMPEVKLVDMKTEYRESGDPVFSRLLLDQVTQKLKRKEQTLVLQNRRGYAAWLMCRDCGNVLECPNCSVTLTYHKADKRMRCHYCDYSRLTPTRCEKCNSVFLHLFGVGTEKIVESLRDKFPDAVVERFDRDTTRQKGSLIRILTRFASREIDILVGTQMLAKGHDFPNITLVSVVGADSSIGIPDFRAAEKLFQLLTQVAGRSGRGQDPGIVILQSFHPTHYAIQCALQQSYERFYEQEIRFRKLMQYPPFVSLANVIFSGKEPSRVLSEARDFAKLILAFKTDAMKMLGPAVAPMAKLAGRFRFQILVKSPSRRSLRECLRSATQHFAQKARHSSQISIDIDPYSIV